MFEEEDCGYCARWEREVGGVYSRTAEGRLAPLARTELEGADRNDIVLREPVRFTPTFVLLRQGKEVGRITGYLGETQFWGLLGDLLRRNTKG